MSRDSRQMRTDPVVTAAMLIRRPAGEVFEAFVDPDITTKFWFTKSSGRLVPGADVRRDWEMYNASAGVRVVEVVNDRRILIDWGNVGDDDDRTTVEWRFTPRVDGTTFVEITEAGYSGDADQVVTRALGSMGAFTMVLSAVKALLEHDIVLTVVADRFPKDLEAPRDPG